MGPLPSTFDTIHPIDWIFGTYNERSLYFQLIETTWCPWQTQQHNDVTSGRHLAWIFKFSNFFSNLNTENSEKTIFSDWNLQNCEMHCKIISI